MCVHVCVRLSRTACSRSHDSFRARERDGGVVGGGRGGSGDGGGGDGSDGDGGVRVCIVVVVLLGVLSMRRAAVIGKSIPDGTNQLALKYIIRIRRRTDAPPSSIFFETILASLLPPATVPRLNFASPRRSKIRKYHKMGTS